MQDVTHIYQMIDHLIESMEDTGVDPSIIELISDAKELLEESQAHEDNDQE
jgi:hypothetical protein